MIQFTRPTIIAACLGGALWTAKVLGITATDGGFGAAEDVTFLAGLACLLAACVLAGADVARRLRGPARIAATAGATLGFVALTIAAEAIGVAVIGGLYSGGNVGIEDEGGILLAGLAWLALALSCASSARAYPRGHGEAHEVRAGVA